jgi:hypothetical protein
VVSATSRSASRFCSSSSVTPTLFRATVPMAWELGEGSDQMAGLLHISEIITPAGRDDREGANAVDFHPALLGRDRLPPSRVLAPRHILKCTPPRKGDSMNCDFDEARRHLEITADLVVVHDVMAEALSELWGVYSRASGRCVEGSPDHAWWRTQARAVRQFRDSIDVRDRVAMLAALESGSHRCRIQVVAGAVACQG